MSKRITLEEAIKGFESAAEDYERGLQVYENMDDEDRLLFKEEENECKEYAKEHRQLAEWLKELKELRKNKIGIYGRTDAIGVGCANCIYLKTEDYTKRPCGICCFNYSSKFEEVNADGDSN